MDSSGVGALLAAYKSTHEAGGTCKLVGAPPQVLRTLRRMNLDKVFERFEDETAAVSSF
jgi:anti-anti-sigma factor